MVALKLEELNEGINHFTVTNRISIIVLIIFIVGLIFLGLSLKKLVEMNAKIQDLEKLI